MYNSENYVVLDFETTNHEKGDALNPENRIVLAVWWYQGKQKMVRGTEHEMLELLQDIQQADFLVAQNAKFELAWLHRCGLDVSRALVADTEIAEYVLLGNRKKSLSLGEMAKRYGYPGKEPYVDRCIRAGICPSELPASLLEKRCRYDVDVTAGIWRKQREILNENVLLPCFFTRCIFTSVLTDIEGRGLCLDKERVYEEYRKQAKRSEELSRRMSEITGGINPRSPVQMADFIYDTLRFAEPTERGGEPIRTTTGRRKADAGTLGKLRATNKKQREFLEVQKELAKVNAKLTKALNNFKECVDNGELLYAKFNQCVTVTHRLSSSGKRYGVQFQNLPREYKSLFKARSSANQIAEIDGAQLEFRVAAHLGRDAQATRDIRDGTDVHSYTASVLSDAGQETSRQDAKAHTFKPLYGGSSGTKAEKAYYSDFKEKYPGISSAQQAWCLQAATSKKLKCETGLTFYFPYAKITRRGYVEGTTEICNYPVQNLATAEIIPIAVTKLWHDMKARNMKSFLVNTVHDSAIAEIVPEEKELFQELAENAFTDYVYSYLHDVYGINFSVPLGTGFKCGDHWGEGEEVTKSVEPPEWT